MALKPKFRISWIVLSAVFISLSASLAEQQMEGHKCYWCGPLAEQVHRSQRAPKCIGDRSNVTVCDEDLPYCAIVAKSPPYVESRYCVKFYQDECYSLYCNTTKTWKITCPCRGELCNGINTLRENEAFKVLKHNIGKIAQDLRFKRTIMNSISKAGFLGLSSPRNKIDNTTTDEMKEIQNKTIPAIATETRNKTILNTDHESSAVNITDTATKIEATSEKPQSISATTEVNSNLTSEFTKTDEMIPNSSEPTTPASEPAINTRNLIKNNEDHLNTTVKDITTINKDSTRNETMKQIDIPSEPFISNDLKTDIIIGSSELPKVVNVTTTELTTKFEDVTTIAATKATTLNNKVTHETASVIESMTEANINVSKSKSIKKLPSPDALQHNDTPIMKTDQIFTPTTNMNMLITPATTPGNNTAVRIESSILQYTVAISIILYY